jgi:[acyl-carrier-protein] S-malonyltransferase
VAANYNCPGQLVISEKHLLLKSSRTMKEAGAKRALLLPVGGAFHSMMEPAREELAALKHNFLYSHLPSISKCNSNCSPLQKRSKKLIIQLAPVKWTQSVQQMIADGATLFTK